MIKYTLVCQDMHEFESWFRNSAAFEEQSSRGLVECPVCQSTNVTKSVMAPFVRTGARLRDGNPSEDSAAAAALPVSAPAAPPTPEQAEKPQPVVLLDERQRALRAMVRELRSRIMESADDVGARFPEEARRMHEGVTERRSIYGQAMPEEARALVEEGIDIMPIPNLPDDWN